jgi:hypothetical protein
METYLQMFTPNPVKVHDFNDFKFDMLWYIFL